MTSPSETAYPRLKPDPTPEELEKIYTPTKREMVFVESIASRPVPRTAMLIHLKVFQRLGRLISIQEVPLVIREHIAKAAGVARTPSLAEFKRFERAGARVAKIKSLREFIGVERLDNQGFAWLDHVAETAAETKHSVADIINVMLEELVRNRYELPAFSTLDRAAFRAREQSNNRYFTSITATLGLETKAMIDALMKTDPGSTHSGWHSLKREPRRPTNKETRIYLQHIEHLQRIVETLPKPDVPVPKLRQFRYLARALDAAEMAKLKPQKRYALAVVFIRAQYAQAMDDAAQLFIRLMQNLENRARQKLLEFQLDRQQKTDMLIGQLKDCLQAYSINGTEKQRVDAIETALVAPVKALIADCDEHLAVAGKNYLPFLLQPYKSVRAQMLNCIQIAAPRASSDDLTSERMLAALMSLRTNRLDHVLLADLNLDVDADFTWMSAQWKKLVLVKLAAATKVNAVHRRYFELAVMQSVKDELKSGDLFIKHGERYDDYREQLVDDATYEREVVEYGLVTSIEIRPGMLTRQLQEELLAKALEVDAGFPNNAHAEIVDGRLILRKPATLQPTPELEMVEELLTNRMDSVGIVDVLIAAERWLDLHKLFRPLAGTESRLADLRMRFITTLFCYGCNLGPTQTARSIRGLSPKQIAWLNLKNVSEDMLEKAIVKVINAFNKFDLPGYWGSGKHASADGTKWDLYEKNLFSEYHIRYGGYGGIGYYHVSDKFIALFSNFITCGTYEGLNILDGFENNESDIKPDTLHGDTHAQSYPVFALSYLLGIKLMPRIRGVNDLNFFRPTAGAKFENINDLFGGAINWQLIDASLPAMFRIAVSVKLGKITPSAILRRLGTYSRKNKLYVAFQELGKAIRTKFLLSYIGDVELRRVIHAETNKSEQFNAFAHWSFFGQQGEIAENMRHEQRKLIKYNHLVTNMVILYNVHEMTRVLAALREEGVEITPEILAGLAPYRNRHINRFGDYVVDFRKKVLPMLVKLGIF